MATVAYRRVSSISQSVDRQLPDEKFDKEFEDKISAGEKLRPGLQQALEFTRPGDYLVVHSIDRLARNLAELEQLIKLITDNGVTVQFRKEQLSFKPAADPDPMAKLMLQLIGSVAEFERSMIKERQREGIAAAISAGKKFGRPRSLTDQQLKSLRAKKRAGLTTRQLQNEFNLSKSTVNRLTKKLKKEEQLELIK